MVIIACIYVDDTIIAYSKEDESIWLSDKARIGARYPIKDIGICSWILNMSVTRDRSAGILVLCQSAYIKRVLAAKWYA